jgi:hypothetical protein
MRDRPAGAGGADGGYRTDVESVTILIDCAPEAVEPLREQLAGPAAELQATPQRNLDGTAAASWLVLAVVAVKQLPETIRALAEFLTRDRVARIEVGDFVVENPSAEDVRQILRSIGPAAVEPEPETGSQGEPAPDTP